MTFFRPLPTACGAALGLAALSNLASAQVHFSLDWRSPSTAPPGITHGDVLMPSTVVPAYGPIPPPVVIIPGGPGGLAIPTWGPCMLAPILPPCPIEVDALSYATDAVLTPMFLPAGRIVFSVDEFAVGAPGSMLVPNVLSEAPFGDSSADIFRSLGLPPGPVGPFVGGNSGYIDGNGLVSPSFALYPGLGLIEPDMPMPGFMLDGDDVDALEIPEGPIAPMGVWFSLDAGFFDPATGTLNLGTAMANGFLPGAVLWTPPGGAPLVYAPPLLLGLDLLGPGTDDLDALILCENLIPGWQPSPGPYIWGPGMPDMLLFSVRRGSLVIGALDSLLGIAIQPGDILIPPPVPGMTPGILYSAESLGLATTRTHGLPFGGDDVDALDALRAPPTGIPYCSADPTSAVPCPCGNFGAPGNGCANSLFAAGANLTAAGTAQVSADTVVLTGTNMPNGPALYFQGTAQGVMPFGDGLRCVFGMVRRFPIQFNVGFTSTYPGGGNPPISVVGAIPAVGGIRHYQIWYRNGAALFCPPATFNLSNALSIVWTP